VIFAFWRPELCVVGAYLFGGLSALPYVMTIVVLVAVSSAGARLRLGAPAGLGIPYVREER